MPEHSKPVRLAAAAYRAALAGKWDAAGRALQRISDECGGEGVEIALIGWCDTYADHATGGLPARQNVNINFMHSDTGQLDGQDSERVPPQYRWAARLVRARAALDHDQWRKLTDELPADAAGIGTYVFAVLQTVALSVNGLPRGYARMGQADA